MLVPLKRFQCATCSFGASSRIAPERCPMCGGAAWHLRDDRLLSQLGVQA